MVLIGSPKSFVWYSILLLGLLLISANTTDQGQLKQLCVWDDQGYLQISMPALLNLTVSFSSLGPFTMSQLQIQTSSNTFSFGCFGSCTAHLKMSQLDPYGLYTVRMLNDQTLVLGMVEVCADDQNIKSFYYGKTVKPSQTFGVIASEQARQVKIILTLQKPDRLIKQPIKITVAYLNKTQIVEQIISEPKIIELRFNALPHQFYLVQHFNCNNCQISLLTQQACPYNAHYLETNTCMLYSLYASIEPGQGAAFITHATSEQNGQLQLVLGHSKPFNLFRQSVDGSINEFTIDQNNTFEQPLISYHPYFYQLVTQGQSYQFPLQSTSYPNNKTEKYFVASSDRASSVDKQSSVFVVTSSVDANVTFISHGIDSSAIRFYNSQGQIVQAEYSQDQVVIPMLTNHPFSATLHYSKSCGHDRHCNVIIKSTDAKLCMKGYYQSHNAQCKTLSHIATLKKVNIGLFVVEKVSDITVTIDGFDFTTKLWAYLKDVEGRQIGRRNVINDGFLVFLKVQPGNYKLELDEAYLDEDKTIYVTLMVGQKILGTESFPKPFTSSSVTLITQSSSPVTLKISTQIQSVFLEAFTYQEGDKVPIRAVTRHQTDGFTFVYDSVAHKAITLIFHDLFRDCLGDQDECEFELLASESMATIQIADNTPISEQLAYLKGSNKQIRFKASQTFYNQGIKLVKGSQLVLRMVEKEQNLQESQDIQTGSTEQGSNFEQAKISYSIVIVRHPMGAVILSIKFNGYEETEVDITTDQLIDFIFTSSGSSPELHHIALKGAYSFEGYVAFSPISEPFTTLWIPYEALGQGSQLIEMNRRLSPSSLKIFSTSTKAQVQWWQTLQTTFGSAFSFTASPGLYLIGIEKADALCRKQCQLRTNFAISDILGDFFCHGKTAKLNKMMVCNMTGNLSRHSLANGPSVSLKSANFQGHSTFQIQTGTSVNFRLINKNLTGRLLLFSVHEEYTLQFYNNEPLMIRETASYTLKMECTSSLRPIVAQIIVQFDSAPFKKLQTVCVQQDETMRSAYVLIDKEKTHLSKIVAKVGQQVNSLTSYNSKIILKVYNSAAEMVVSSQSGKNELSFEGQKGPYILTIQVPKVLPLPQISIQLASDCKVCINSNGGSQFSYEDNVGCFSTRFSQGDIPARPTYIGLNTETDLTGSLFYTIPSHSIISFWPSVDNIGPGVILYIDVHDEKGELYQTYQFSKDGQTTEGHCPSNAESCQIGFASNQRYGVATELNVEINQTPYQTVFVIFKPITDLFSSKKSIFIPIYSERKGSLVASLEEEYGLKINALTSQFGMEIGSVPGRVVNLTQGQRAVSFRSFSGLALLEIVVDSSLCSQNWQMCKTGHVQLSIHGPFSLCPLDFSLKDLVCYRQQGSLGQHQNSHVVSQENTYYNIQLEADQILGVQILILDQSKAIKVVLSHLHDEILKYEGRVLYFSPARETGTYRLKLLNSKIKLPVIVELFINNMPFQRHYLFPESKQIEEQQEEDKLQQLYGTKKSYSQHQHYLSFSTPSVLKKKSQLIRVSAGQQTSKLTIIIKDEMQTEIPINIRRGNNQIYISTVLQPKTSYFMIVEGPKGASPIQFELFDGIKPCIESFERKDSICTFQSELFELKDNLTVTLNGQSFGQQAIVRLIKDEAVSFQPFSYFEGKKMENSKGFNAKHKSSNQEQQFDQDYDSGAGSQEQSFQDIRIQLLVQDGPSLRKIQEIKPHQQSEPVLVSHFYRVRVLCSQVKLVVLAVKVNGTPLGDILTACVPPNLAASLIIPVRLSSGPVNFMSTHSGFQVKLLQINGQQALYPSSRSTEYFDNWGDTYAQISYAIPKLTQKQSDSLQSQIYLLTIAQTATIRCTLDSLVCPFELMAVGKIQICAPGYTPDPKIMDSIKATRGFRGTPDTRSYDPSQDSQASLEMLFGKYDCVKRSRAQHILMNGQDLRFSTVIDLKGPTQIEIEFEKDQTVDPNLMIGLYSPRHQLIKEITVRQKVHLYHSTMVGPHFIGGRSVDGSIKIVKAIIRLNFGHSLETLITFCGLHQGQAVIPVTSHESVSALTFRLWGGSNIALRDLAFSKEINLDKAKTDSQWFEFTTGKPLASGQYVLIISGVSNRAVKLTHSLQSGFSFCSRNIHFLPGRGCVKLIDKPEKPVTSKSFSRKSVNNLYQLPLLKGDLATLRPQQFDENLQIAVYSDKLEMLTTLTLSEPVFLPVPETNSFYILRPIHQIYETKIAAVRISINSIPQFKILMVFVHELSSKYGVPIEIERTTSLAVAGGAIKSWDGKNHDGFPAETVKSWNDTIINVNTLQPGLAYVEIEKDCIDCEDTSQQLSRKVQLFGTHIDCTKDTKRVGGVCEGQDNELPFEIYRIPVHKLHGGAQVQLWPHQSLSVRVANSLDGQLLIIGIYESSQLEKMIGEPQTLAEGQKSVPFPPVDAKGLYTIMTFLHDSSDPRKIILDVFVNGVPLSRVLLVATAPTAVLRSYMLPVWSPNNQISLISLNAIVPDEIAGSLYLLKNGQKQAEQMVRYILTETAYGFMVDEGTEYIMTLDLIEPLEAPFLELAIHDQYLLPCGPEFSFDQITFTCTHIGWNGLEQGKDKPSQDVQKFQPLEQGTHQVLEDQQLIVVRDKTITVLLKPFEQLELYYRHKAKHNLTAVLFSMQATASSFSYYQTCSPKPNNLCLFPPSHFEMSYNLVLIASVPSIVSLTLNINKTKYATIRVAAGPQHTIQSLHEKAAIKNGKVLNQKLKQHSRTVLTSYLPFSCEQLTFSFDWHHSDFAIAVFRADNGQMLPSFKRHIQTVNNQDEDLMTDIGAKSQHKVTLVQGYSTVMASTNEYILMIRGPFLVPLHLYMKKGVRLCSFDHFYSQRIGFGCEHIAQGNSTSEVLSQQLSARQHTATITIAQLISQNLIDLTDCFFLELIVDSKLVDDQTLTIKIKMDSFQKEWRLNHQKHKISQLLPKIQTNSSQSSIESHQWLNLADLQLNHSKVLATLTLLTNKLEPSKKALTIRRNFNSQQQERLVVFLPRSLQNRLLIPIARPPATKDQKVSSIHLQSGNHLQNAQTDLHKFSIHLVGTEQSLHSIKMQLLTVSGQPLHFGKDKPSSQAKVINGRLELYGRIKHESYYIGLSLSLSQEGVLLSLCDIDCPQFSLVLDHHSSYSFCAAGSDYTLSTNNGCMKSNNGSVNHLESSQSVFKLKVKHVQNGPVMIFDKSQSYEFRVSCLGDPAHDNRLELISEAQTLKLPVKTRKVILKQNNLDEVYLMRGVSKIKTILCHVDIIVNGAPFKKYLLPFGQPNSGLYLPILHHHPLSVSTNDLFHHATLLRVHSTLSLIKIKTVFDPAQCAHYTEFKDPRCTQLDLSILIGGLFEVCDPQTRLLQGVCQSKLDELDEPTQTLQLTYSSFGNKIVLPLSQGYCATIRVTQITSSQNLVIRLYDSNGTLVNGPFMLTEQMPQLSLHPAMKADSYHLEIKSMNLETSFVSSVHIYINGIPFATHQLVVRRDATGAQHFYLPVYTSEGGSQGVSYNANEQQLRLLLPNNVGYAIFPTEHQTIHGTQQMFGFVLPPNTEAMLLLTRAGNICSSPEAYCPLEVSLYGGLRFCSPGYQLNSNGFQCDHTVPPPSLHINRIEAANEGYKRRLWPKEKISIRIKPNTLVYPGIHTTDLSNPITITCNLFDEEEQQIIKSGPISTEKEQLSFIAMGRAVSLLVELKLSSPVTQAHAIFEILINNKIVEQIHQVMTSVADTLCFPLETGSKPYVSVALSSSVPKDQISLFDNKWNNLTSVYSQTSVFNEFGYAISSKQSEKSAIICLHSNSIPFSTSSRLCWQGFIHSNGVCVKQYTEQREQKLQLITIDQRQFGKPYEIKLNQVSKIVVAETQSSSGSIKSRLARHKNAQSQTNAVKGVKVIGQKLYIILLISQADGQIYEADSQGILKVPDSATGEGWLVTATSISSFFKRRLILYMKDGSITHREVLFTPKGVWNNEKQNMCLSFKLKSTVPSQFTFEPLNQDVIFEFLDAQARTVKQFVSQQQYFVCLRLNLNRTISEITIKHSAAFVFCDPPFAWHLRQGCSAKQHEKLSLFFTEPSFTALMPKNTYFVELPEKPVSKFSIELLKDSVLLGHQPYVELLNELGDIKELIPLNVGRTTIYGRERNQSISSLMLDFKKESFILRLLHSSSTLIRPILGEFTILFDGIPNKVVKIGFAHRSRPQELTLQLYLEHQVDLLIVAGSSSIRYNFSLSQTSNTTESQMSQLSINHYGVADSEATVIKVASKPGTALLNQITVLSIVADNLLPLQTYIRFIGLCTFCELDETINGFGCEREPQIDYDFDFYIQSDFFGNMPTVALSKGSIVMLTASKLAESQNIAVRLVKSQQNKPGYQSFETPPLLLTHSSPHGFLSQVPSQGNYILEIRSISMSNSFMAELKLEEQLGGLLRQNITLLVPVKRSASNGGFFYLPLWVPYKRPIYMLVDTLETSMTVQLTNDGGVVIDSQLTTIKGSLTLKGYIVPPGMHLLVVMRRDSLCQPGSFCNVGLSLTQGIRMCGPSPFKLAADGKTCVSTNQPSMEPIGFPTSVSSLFKLQVPSNSTVMARLQLMSPLQENPPTAQVRVRLLPEKLGLLPHLEQQENYFVSEWTQLTNGQSIGQSINNLFVQIHSQPADSTKEAYKYEVEVQASCMSIIDIEVVIIEGDAQDVTAQMKIILHSELSLVVLSPLDKPNQLRSWLQFRVNEEEEQLGSLGTIRLSDNTSLSKESSNYQHRVISVEIDYESYNSSSTVFNIERTQIKPQRHIFHVNSSSGSGNSPWKYIYPTTLSEDDRVESELPFLIVVGQNRYILSLTTINEQQLLNKDLHLLIRLTSSNHEYYQWCHHQNYQMVDGKCVRGDKPEWDSNNGSTQNQPEFQEQNYIPQNDQMTESVTHLQGESDSDAGSQVDDKLIDSYIAELSSQEQQDSIQADQSQQAEEQEKQSTVSPLGSNQQIDRLSLLGKIEVPLISTLQYALHNQQQSLIVLPSGLPAQGMLQIVRGNSDTEQLSERMADYQGQIKVYLYSRNRNSKLNASSVHPEDKNTLLVAKPLGVSHRFTYEFTHQQSESSPIYSVQFRGKAYGVENIAISVNGRVILVGAMPVKGSYYYSLRQDSTRLQQSEKDEQAEANYLEQSQHITIVMKAYNPPTGNDSNTIVGQLKDVKQYRQQIQLNEQQAGNGHLATKRKVKMYLYEATGTLIGQAQGYLGRDNGSTAIQDVNSKSTVKGQSESHILQASNCLITLSNPLGEGYYLLLIIPLSSYPSPSSILINIATYSNDILKTTVLTACSFDGNQLLINQEVCSHINNYADAFESPQGNKNEQQGSAQSSDDQSKQTYSAIQSHKGLSQLFSVDNSYDSYVQISLSQNTIGNKIKISSITNQDVITIQLQGSIKAINGETDSRMFKKSNSAQKSNKNKNSTAVIYFTLQDSNGHLLVKNSQQVSLEQSIYRSILDTNIGNPSNTDNHNNYNFNLQLASQTNSKARANSSNQINYSEIQNSYLSLSSTVILQIAHLNVYLNGQLYRQYRSVLINRVGQAKTMIKWGMFGGAFGVGGKGGRIQLGGATQRNSHGKGSEKQHSQILDGQYQSQLSPMFPILTNNPLIETNQDTQYQYYYMEWIPPKGCQFMPNNKDIQKIVNGSKDNYQSNLNHNCHAYLTVYTPINICRAMLGQIRTHNRNNKEQHRQFHNDQPPIMDKQAIMCYALPNNVPKSGKLWGNNMGFMEGVKSQKKDNRRQNNPKNNNGNRNKRSKQQSQQTYTNNNNLQLSSIWYSLSELIRVTNTVDLTNNDNNEMPKHLHIIVETMQAINNTNPNGQYQLKPQLILNPLGNMTLVVGNQINSLSNIPIRLNQKTSLNDLMEKNTDFIRNGIRLAYSNSLVEDYRFIWLQVKLIIDGRIRNTIGILVGQQDQGLNLLLPLRVRGDVSKSQVVTIKASHSQHSRISSLQQSHPNEPQNRHNRFRLSLIDRRNQQYQGTVHTLLTTGLYLLKVSIVLPSTILPKTTKTTKTTKAHTTHIKENSKNTILPAKSQTSQRNQQHHKVSYQMILQMSQSVELCPIGYQTIMSVEQNNQPNYNDDLMNVKNDILPNNNNQDSETAKRQLSNKPFGVPICLMIDPIAVTQDFSVLTTGLLTITLIIMAIGASFVIKCVLERSKRTQRDHKPMEDTNSAKGSVHSAQDNQSNNVDTDRGLVLNSEASSFEETNSALEEVKEQ